MQTAGGPARSPVAGPGGRSSSASPSSSSSAVSTPHLGFDSIQNHQQQQFSFRQQQQQQQLSKSEGESLIRHRAGSIHGSFNSGTRFSQSSIPLFSQPPGKFMDTSRHQGPYVREENQIKGLGPEPHSHNPAHQSFFNYSFQAAHQHLHGSMLQAQSQGNKIGMMAPPGKDQEICMNNLKMQELMSLQAANQAHASGLKKFAERYGLTEKHVDQGQSSEQNMPQHMTRIPLQVQQGPVNMQNHSQLPMAQFQAIQRWALENNVDLSLPANANMIAQILPVLQSKLTAVQQSNEDMASQQSRAPGSKHQRSLSLQPVVSDSSFRGGSVGDGEIRQMPARRPSPALLANVGSASHDANHVPVSRQIMGSGNGMQPMNLSSSTGSINQNVECVQVKSQSPMGPETLQMQHMRQIQQLNKTAQQPSHSSGQSSGLLSSQGGRPVEQLPQQSIGFTKQQLHVLKAQILAFRRLKRGEGSLPQEVLRAIAPPPLDVLQLQQNFLHSGIVCQDRTPGKIVEHLPELKCNIGAAFTSAPLNKVPKEEQCGGDIKEAVSLTHLKGPGSIVTEPAQFDSSGKDEQSLSNTGSVKSETETGQARAKEEGDIDMDGVKAPEQLPITPDTQVQQPAPHKETGSTRKYYGPLFDFSYFSRRHDTGTITTMSNSNKLTLGYDVKNLLFEEGCEVLKRKREENLKKIVNLLAVNLERKRIKPDLVLRLQIEERKLRLIDLQARLRDEMDQQQQDIMAMPDRPYRKFIRLCERQRMELVKQVQMSQKAMREKQLKALFQWRKKLLEAHWAIRDARTARNRGIAKYHERMLREFSKKKDEDRNKRMEALKNNDVDRYREMLLEQQTNIPGDAAQRYAVLSSFLSQTEEYLHKLGCKITAAKSQQEVEEAANFAAAAARSQGLSEEEVRAAAACAGEEVLIRNRFSEMNTPRDNLSVNKYYNLAHAVNERVVRQPSMLRTGTLRDYQLIGLQWMLSLYNNKLNGILADEMGLGKTVQVMALIAYLMEFKGNYGPYLIIVPNAVLVNWKSELHSWLPSVSSIFYVGSKDQRSKLFSQEVCAMKFNVLVTTYEFVMYDRTKLSKVDWKYIIIDEAQRMKDRESVLARDLDRYRCQRRLLLTGTPLQNDLKELWSLLNLLLPEVFDNKKAFHDWFSKPFQKDSFSQEVDDWLETEKKVVIIHRLHQILEPFMLRRRVEDVEGSLPPKVSVVLRCKMSALQGAIYDWIKSTGTIRVDPEDEQRRVEKNPSYQVKTYKNLNNKCMELRKVCNHPLLNYPYLNEYSKEFIVRSCGKLWVLDRILVKLQRAGHRVLLFSTMTKLLDILEEYLQWRRLVYRRIDGTTSLEERESAIVDFNSPDSGCFIFLLSIRAAGRGLNLQTADTVVIYDPDPNPKNEEQAVARAHRIGQKREVKVIYMEAVVDKISSHQKENELRSGGTIDHDDDLVGKDRYIGSIESLIRNNIQQYKIDMADEVINAGRFDQRTTHEERRMTLEALLHDEERYQENVHDVPSLQEVNRMIARSEEEVELFDQMDEEFDWAGEMIRYEQVPKWLRTGTREVNALLANLSKKSLKGGLGIGIESSETISDISPVKGEKRRVRLKNSTLFAYNEFDDEIGEDSEASSEERNEYGMHEEEEMAEFEDEDFCEVVDVAPRCKDDLDEEGIMCGGSGDNCDGYDFLPPAESARSGHIFEEAVSTASSSGSQRFAKIAASSLSYQKFGSLSALDARPACISTRMPDELEEGEIAVSGDSHVDFQQSGSWTHERDDGEDEQVLQPKIKRKRSMRTRPRYSVERLREISNKEKMLVEQGGNSIYVSGRKSGLKGKESGKHDLAGPVFKQRRNLMSRKGVSCSRWNAANALKLDSLAGLGDLEDVAEHSVESWDDRSVSISRMPTCSGLRMSEVVQRKCKNACSRFQRRIVKEGHQFAPRLTGFWRRMEDSAVTSLDLRKIYVNIGKFQYSSEVDFVSDVLSMLKSSVQYCGSSYEVRLEAKRLQDIFFDILKNLGARNSALVSAMGMSSQRPTTNQNKWFKPINSENELMMPSLHGADLLEDDDSSKYQGEESSRSCKELRLMNCNGPRDQEEALLPPAHPGELVICKKKRKDREKAVAKMRSPVGLACNAGQQSQSRSVGCNAIQFQSRSIGWVPQPQQQPLVSPRIVNDVQWAKPVKRMRTDSGKRRPSHF